MERRDFLDPRRLANAAGELDDVADAAAPVLLRCARRAMATTFEAIFPFGTPDVHRLSSEALDEIDRLEAQLTVYRDSSEVSRLNAAAHRGPRRVAPNLFELLTLCRRLHDATEGAFDVAVGAIIRAWGFYRREGRVPPSHEREQALARSGMPYVALDEQKQTVHFLRPGLEINFGSVGKGYALDRAATLIHGAGGPAAFLLHGGHSSVLARGAEMPGRRGWAVGLLDPVRPQCRRGILHLRDRALATSAATHQHFEHEGRKLGHLIDPRIGWPAEGVLSATATAPTATEADALATAFFVLGADKTAAYCAAHPEIGAALITQAQPHRLLLLGRAVDEVSRC